MTTEITTTVCLTYEQAAIHTYFNLLDKPVEWVKERYPAQWEEGMTKEELAYAVVKANFA